jgi:DNA-binding NarL/FixJ family response regulator
MMDGAGLELGPSPDNAEPALRVLLADDQALIRAGFRVLIESARDLAMAGEASNGVEAVSAAQTLRPDVVLMDIRMPVLDGLEATRRIVADPELAGVHVLILTTFESDEYVFEALRAGASGFVLKDIEPTDLLNAIRVVASGEGLLSPSVTRRLIAEFATRPVLRNRVAELASLTERELEILRYVGEGQSNSDIADALVVSPATVKTHVNRIMSKLDAHDRAQLVVAAYESGLVIPGR